MMYEFKPEDAYRFAQHVGIKTFERGGNLHFKKCPYCQQFASRDEKTFAINLENGTFNCFRASCGAKGNMITLARDFDFSLGKDVDNYYFRKRTFRTFKTPEKPIEPKEAAIQYLTGRGISEEVIRRYEITTQAGNDQVIVFPFFDENGRLTTIKYRNSAYRKGIDKAKEWYEKDCKPILFGMKQCDHDNPVLVITEGECFDGKAEILTPNGWVRFEDYGGEDVLQVDNNMRGSFVKPKRYIVKRYQGKMVKISRGGNYESYTTESHNLVYMDRKGNILKSPAKNHVSERYNIPTAIFLDECKYSDWTDDMFGLYLAISADGTIDTRKGTGPRKPKSPRYARIAIFTDRKYERIKGYLHRLKIEHSDTIDGRNAHSICFPCPEWLASKFLPYGFATGTTIKQKKYILSEMVEWDGNRVNNRNQYEFNTTIKHNADVMQLIASSCGYMSTVMSRESGGRGDFVKSYIYKVSILLGKSCVSTRKIDSFKEYVDVDQRVYCVTVDTGMILVRQNNKISVSGNCDALAVATAGISNALSVPGGAKNFTWVPHCWDWVNSFDELIVFGDYENGHITLLEELSNKFHLTVKHVREEDYKDCKDANEILQKYGPEQIEECIKNAIGIPVEHVVSLADVPNLDVFEIPKLATGIDYLDRTLYGGLPFGGVTLITAKPGSGKSTLASQILVQAAEQGYRCFAYSGELSNTLFKSWMNFQVAGHHVMEYSNRWGDKNYRITDRNLMLISEWYRDKIDIFDSTTLPGDGSETENLLEIVEESIMRNGTQVVLIDNLMTAIDLEANRGTDKYERQSNFVKKVTRIALKHQVLILLVAHKRKNNFSNNENDEISGSGDIANLGMIVLSYDKDDQLDPSERVLKLSKNRLFGRVNTNGWALKFDEKSKRIYQPSSNPYFELSWNPDDKSYGFMDINEETPWG